MGLVPGIEVLEAFAPLRGTQEVAAYGAGHIHDTFLIKAKEGQFILQRFNHHVFTQPQEVGENIARVSAHLKNKMRGSYPYDYQSRYLQIISSGNQPFFQDAQGLYWRLFRYVPETMTIDFVERPQQAREAARAFGEFVRLLGDLEPKSFHATIPHFHDLRYRLAQLEGAIQQADLQRKQSAVDLLERLPKAANNLLSQIPFSSLPLRLLHNDTKINNLLFDQQSLKAKCVIDLDTVMPGYLLYDFGDLVRTSVSLSAEDEQDLTKIVVRSEILEALEDGFVAGLGKAFREAEIQSLKYGGPYMALIMATRFLTDYLQGDPYYKTNRPAHNLDRARNQFRLFELLTC
ncbi:MAG: aminoglycoside phosphotransferase family protein [Bacteroidota bacterium]